MSYLPILLLGSIHSISAGPYSSCFSRPAATAINGIDSTQKRIIAGALLLSGEYIAGPIIAYQAWWSNGFKWSNPFSHIREEEPYLADNAWHLISCTVLCDYHYLIFSRYLRISHPKVASAGLTFLTYTGIECLDAIERTGRWSFSIGDEIGNCLGIGFWAIKMHFPSLPVYIRVGIRDWGTAFTMAREVPLLFQDYEEYFASHSDHYAISKVDCIYKVYDELYCGVSLSKEEKPSVRDVWGITIGYDIPMAINKKKEGWWNPIITYASRYGDFLLSFTFWIT